MFSKRFGKSKQRTNMSSCSTKLALLIVGLVASFSAVQAMVAGVDFGGEFFKIALVKPGTPFEIVTNVHSKRKTETMVAFDGEERLYGADAATVGVRRPQTAYSQIRRFLGSTLDHPDVVSLLKEEYFPYDLLQNDTRGSISLKHDKGKNVFHAEELVAMVFSHAKQITNSFAEAKVNDWVLTVPDFFSQAQRQAILDAAELTGVRVLSLINENTAAALQLGVYSSFTDTHRVLFYNMGSTSVQVSIVEYTARIVPDGFKKNKTEIGFQVLAKSWDENMGGSKFDLRLAEHLADEFSKKIGEDIRKHPRTMAKIRAQAKKTKIVLSANDEIPVVMQSLYKDTDFITQVSRKQFETLCEDLFSRVMTPVEKALEKSGLSLIDINDVEIIGGGVRMPKLQQQLKDYFSGKDLGVHLNGDEAMALGAAFYGANISNAFRVRNVPMTDVASYAVGVRLVDLDHKDSTTTTDSEEESGKHWVKRASLFTETSRLGSRKSVSFSHDRDISATFRYDKPSSLPAGVSAHIGKYNITGIEKFAKSIEGKDLGLPKVSLSFELDSNGIMSIAKAEATVEEEVEVEVKVEVPIEGEEEEDESSDEASAEEKKEEEEEEKKKTEEDSKDKKKSKKDKKDSKKKKQKTESRIEKQMKKKIHREVLQVVLAHETFPLESSDMSVLPMSVSAKKDSIKMLLELDAADAKRRADLEAKNGLETFVYNARDTLSGKEAQVIQVTQPEQVEKLQAALEETEDWLYDDGEKADAETYNKKRKTLDDQLQAILFRVSELKALPDALNVAKEYAFSTKELMKEWEENKPQITEEERQDVIEKVEEVEAWMEEQEAKQKKLKAYEDPVLKSSDVEKKVQSVKKLVSTLSKRPKPKAKEEEKPKDDEATDAKKEEEGKEDDKNKASKEEEEEKEEDATEHEEL